jgi:hypothetical protein
MYKYNHSYTRLSIILSYDWIVVLRKIRTPSQMGPVLRVYFRARRLRAKTNTPATHLEQVQFSFS